MKVGKPQITVSRYEHTNELINVLLDRNMLDEDEFLWIVQGTWGRLPIIAGSEEQAIKSYLTHKKSYSSNIE